MRYIKLLLLVILVYFSKCFFDPEVSKDFKLHTSIQEDMKSILAESIKIAVPNADNIQFAKLWTSRIDKQAIQVDFSFSFDDMATKNPINLWLQGFATLKQLAPSKWSLESIKIEDETIDYKNELIIEVEP